MRFGRVGLVLWTLGAVGCGARTGLVGADEAGAGGSSSASSTSSTSSSGCTDAVLGTDPDGAIDLAIDGTDVYWTTLDGKLMKSGLDGPGAPLAEGLESPSGVAVSGGDVFFTELTRVTRMPKVGGAREVIAEGQNLPMVVVADESGVWWLNRGQGIASGSLVLSLGGGSTQTVFDQIDTPSDLVMDATHLYFAASFAKVNGTFVSGPLVRVPKPTGAPELLAQDLHEPAGLLVEGSQLYWLEQVDATSAFPGRLRVMPKEGGTPSDVAGNDDVLALRVAVDGTSAYVTGLEGTGAEAHGVLRRIDLASGTWAELARTNGTVYGAVRSTADAVYWTVQWAPGAQPPGSPSVRKLCK